MTKKLRVLIVEDSKRDAALLNQNLTKAGYELESQRVDDAAAMRAAIQTKEWDIVLCDYSMPGFDALQALEVLKQSQRYIPLIIISDAIGEATAVKAIKAGAKDYLMKDNLVRLTSAIEQALTDAENRQARHVAETELRDKETLLSESQRIAHVGSWTMDIRSDVTTWTDETYRIFGVSRATFAVNIETFLDRIHSDDLPAVQEWIRACSAGEHPRGLEFCTVLPNGEVRTLSGRGRLEYARDGSPLRLIGTVQDITERKKADDALLESVEKFNQLAANIDDVFWIQSLDGQTLHYVSPAYKTIWDGPVEGLYSGKVRLTDAVIDEDRESVIATFAALTGDVLNVDLECRIMRTDAEQRWVRLRGFQVRDATGQLIRTAGIASDITSQKESQKIVRITQERYRELIENAHDVIYTRDLDGNYTSINTAGEKLYGYTREEFAEMHVTQLVAPEHLARAYQKTKQKLDGAAGTSYEMDVFAKDGRRISLEVNTTLTYRDGVPTGVQGIARDVTERKSLEKQLWQSQKLESIGRLAGGIAHDFNNMLTAINGYSELVLLKLSQDDPNRESITEIKKAGERAAALTSQLLAFSRKQILRPELVKINDIVKDTSKMLERLIGEEVQLVATLSSSAGKVKADRGQLSQIIINLVVNARDAMSGGGILSIETENVIADSDFASHHIDMLPGEYVKLSVSDTGTGMTPEIQARIFEPFFSTKALGKGTGLGLSTVYGIIKQSFGCIFVDSVPDSGTTFSIFLPRVGDQTGAEAERTQQFTIATGLETILLVEDEELVRTLTRHVLESCGYTIIEANDGVEALEIFERDGPMIDLVFTDLVMPRMGGRELAEILIGKAPDLLILFSSGYTEDAVIRQGFMESNFNFIQKPFTRHDLSRAVRDLLDRVKK